MKPLIFIALTLTGIFFTGCKKDPDEQRISWSTEAPLSIPYRLRIQRLEKNNLLRNSSFETGKILKVDSLKSSYVIDGWHQMGEHVEWVDTRAADIYGKNEAYSGYRSVKIVRRQANETDQQGEGVVSEFIKVIPGNYNFSFYARLEKVRPVKSRLGVKMNDGVDIRLLFYDRNKNEISAEADFPQLKRSIDNSFKSLSLANFSSIDDFGWGRIIGKSADFPFPDGDIPTQAHYVKVFIGLKGTGTMWVDSVNFSYTKKNFSVEERMMSYTDTSVQMPLFVIPTPKKMEREESVSFFEQGDTARLPLIIIPDNADESTRKAASLLQNALSARISNLPVKSGKNPGVRIVSARHAKPDGRNLVFILGKTSIFPEFADKLPAAEISGHPQGYYIYSPNDLPHVVFLGGNNSQGVYYAALTAVQLIDRNKPVFHNSRIVDYPDFENRYFTLDELQDQTTAVHYAEISGELANYKMNGAFYKVTDLKDLLKGSPLFSYKEKVARQPFFGLGIISRDNKTDPAIGADRTVYAPAWIVPEDSTLCFPEYIDVPAADSSIAPAPIMITPVYNNYLLDYFQLMNQVTFTSSSSASFYSGSSFFSLNTDDADFKRYLDYTHSKPVFMDNSMLASSPWGQFNGAYPYYPGKIRLFSIIEPFLNRDIREHLGQLDSSLYWINQTARSETDVIRLATAADFMWNTRDYDPDYSLWKVLVSRYGVYAARELVHFANQYGLMLETELKLQRNEQVQRNLKNIREDLTELSVSSRNIERWLGSDHPLTKDIRSLNTLLKARLEHLTSSKVSNP